MTQVVTIVESSAVTPVIANGSVTRTTDSAIPVGSWSTPIAVDTTATFTATPGTGGSLIIQLSFDNQVSWRDVRTLPFSTTVVSGVSPNATHIRASAIGAVGTLVVDIPIPTILRPPVVESDGVPYLVLSDGSLMPLAPVIGTGHSPTIGGSPLKAVLLDEGSDAAHAKLLYTLNCYAGDPDTSDVDLMSARFNAADTNEEVIDLSITGGAAGAIVIHGPSSGYITMIHLAREDSGAYTEAAGATVTARQAVLAHWPESQLIRSVMLYIGESYAGGGSNQRYREIIVVGFTAS